jgi:hypothetical protein
MSDKTENGAIGSAGKRPRPIIFISTKQYASLTVEEIASGMFGIGDGRAFETIRGATRIAQKKGFGGMCLTPYVHEYLKINEEGNL